MQIKKTVIKNRILTSAKNLFLTLGFKKTTIKMIATDAKISVANIYNYYSSKDELLKAILISAISVCQNFVSLNTKEKVWGDLDQWSVKSETKRIISFFNILFSYKDEFLILFSKANGSMYENYYLNLIETITALRSQTMQKVLESKMSILIAKTPLFLTRSITKTYLDIIFNGFSNNLSKPQIESQLTETVQFMFFGFSKYFVAKKNKT